MAPTSMAAAQNASQKLLTQTAIVYGENPSTGASGGRYTVVLNPSLVCRMVHPSYGGAGSAGARAEIMADRDLWWDAGYRMPEQCRIVVDGIAWQPRAGTFAALGDGVTVVARRCMVTRVQISAFT